MHRISTDASPSDKSVATKGLGCRRENAEGGFVSGTCTGVPEETKRNEAKGGTSDEGMGDDVTAGDG